MTGCRWWMPRNLFERIARYQSRWNKARRTLMALPVRQWNNNISDEWNEKKRTEKIYSNFKGNLQFYAKWIDCWVWSVMRELVSRVSLYGRIWPIVTENFGNEIMYCVIAHVIAGKLKRWKWRNKSSFGREGFPIWCSIDSSLIYRQRRPIIERNEKDCRKFGPVNSDQPLSDNNVCLVKAIGSLFDASSEAQVQIKRISLMPGFCRCCCLICFWTVEFIDHFFCSCFFYPFSARFTCVVVFFPVLLPVCWFQPQFFCLFSAFVSSLRFIRKISKRRKSPFLR